MENLGLKDKVVIITGSSRGIGLAAAKALGEFGATVFLHGRDAANLQAKVMALRAESIRAEGVAGDVRDRDFARSFVHQVISERGKIDVLINNVGIYDYTPIEEITDEHWQRVLDINLHSSFMFSREVVPHMKQHKAGKIINISSAVGRFGRIYGAHYSAAKGGMIAMTQALAKELGPFGITVNAIAPGFVATDTSLAGARIRNFDLNRFQKSIPLQRIASSQDVANAILFFASNLSDFVSGEVLMVTGGQYVF